MKTTLLFFISGVLLMCLIAGAALFFIGCDGLTTDCICGLVK